MATTDHAALQQNENQDGDRAVDQLPFGRIHGNIVGIRYYSGTAHPGEFIELVREPHNPYDSNAIRVDNMHGQKVGYIKRQQAVGLAHLMDNFSDKVVLDASVTPKGDRDGIPSFAEIKVLEAEAKKRSNKKTFQMPITIDLVSISNDPTEPDLIQEILRQKHLKVTRLAQSTSLQSSQDKYDDVAEVSKDEVKVETKKVNWKAQTQDLDALFEKLSKQQLEALPEIDFDALPLQSELFDHQKLGIRWLVSKEKPSEKDDIPFFTKVEEQGKIMWLSDLTKSSQPEKPKHTFGSILADDMGLGKTIQTIGLILANPPDGIVYGTSNRTSVDKENTKESPRPTLIVCPVSVASNWTEQIESHVKSGCLKTVLYAGPDRTVEGIEHNDVVIVSYSTLAYDFGKYFEMTTSKTTIESRKKKAKKAKTIFDIPFHRIVLDEAHIVRNMATRNFKAVREINAKHVACLTGTPITNRPSDISSLFTLLGIEPLHKPDVFRRTITQPIMGGDLEGLDRLRTMMAYIALRRTKALANITLPEKTIQISAIEFPAGKHKEIHDALFNSARGVFAAALRNGSDDTLKNYSSVFEILLRVRQACCSGALVPEERWQRAMSVLKELDKRGSANPLTNEEAWTLLEKLKGIFEEEEAFECAVCFDQLDAADAVILRTCRHIFCESCTKHIAAGTSSKCPLCRVEFMSTDMIKKDAAYKAVAHQSKGVDVEIGESNELGVSPKISALLESIGKDMKPEEKGVIFSQFTKFLDEIEKVFLARGMHYTRIDGSNSVQKRIESMRDFSAEGGPRFILCSLKSCGVGLNLTRGNHVYMMDTWWNLAVELQAMDRVHRIGQTRPVKVVRFVMSRTIEERMVTLQETKAAVGKGALEKLSPEEARRVRMCHLRNLFELSLASEG